MPDRVGIKTDLTCKDLSFYPHLIPFLAYLIEISELPGLAILSK